MTEPYTTPQVAAMIDRSVYKTISFITRGFTKPSIQDANGHGTKRLWSEDDVVRMATVATLQDAGFTAEAIRQWDVNSMDLSCKSIDDDHWDGFTMSIDLDVIRSLIKEREGSIPGGHRRE